MAGALGLRLCGPAVYFGVLHDKPWIGDERRPIEPGDIGRACRMEVAGAVLGLVLFSLLRLGTLWIIGG
jgi:adenosylcobinamide-phosphate synthase